MSAGVLAARQARSQPDRLFSTVVAFQLALVAAESDATSGMLEEQGIRDDPFAVISPAGLVGVASDGRDLGSLLTLPDLDPHQFDRIVATQLQDVARSAAAIERAVRPNVTAYVRVVNLPSCGRCIILAGTPSPSETPFRRHPRCDCTAAPSNGRIASRFVTDPGEAFDRMSKAEQDKAFTAAGAEAVRLGADPARVVNARRGMDIGQPRASLTGHTAHRNKDGMLSTTEGTGTRRSRRELAVAMRAGGVSGPRLMPESIIAAADTDTERIRLLRAYGYIR